MEPLIGVINTGSSSLKFTFYEGDRWIISGEVGGIGGRPTARASRADGKALEPLKLGPTPPATPSDVLGVLIPWAKAAAAMVRIARFPDDSVARRGRRIIRGGRYPVRSKLYMRLLSAIRCNLVLKQFYE
jgi:acetate kinase